MEQPVLTPSILTPEVQRWVSAIVKLTSLTYQGRVGWVREDLDSANGPVGFRFTSTKYQSELEGQSFILIISKPEPTTNTSWSELLGMPGYKPEPTINFRAFDRNGRKAIDLTRLSVLQSLADAVEAQTANHEQTVLDAIEKA